MVIANITFKGQLFMVDFRFNKKDCAEFNSVQSLIFYKFNNTIWGTAKNIT